MSTLGTVALTDLARWVEARLDLMIGFVIPEPMGYGVTVIDPALLHDPDAPAARMCPLRGERADDFDALALVINEWAIVDELHRGPGAYAQRRRARVVVVSCDGGRAIVRRWEHEPDSVLVCPQ